MQDLTFGIEIETIKQTRQTVAKAIQSVVGATVQHEGLGYDAWTVKDAKGRSWKVVMDASLNADREHQAEIVSPILKAEDIAEMQEVVRAVRAAGAKVDTSCGIHIHIGADRFNPQAVTNLVKMVNKQEELIYAALAVAPSRKAAYAKPVDANFLRKIETRKPARMDDLNVAWYGQLNRNPVHYDNSRYHGVNLHNVWYRGTVEFRWFEATLHAGRTKAYLQFCLAVAAKALNGRAASSRKRDFDPQSAKYDFRVFLLHLGLIGDEFKTARKHLMANMPGDAAFKNGRPKPEDVLPDETETTTLTNEAGQVPGLTV